MKLNILLFINKIMKRIIFIGMCYSGKTTLGREVSERLGYRFLDSRDLFFKFYKMSENEYLQKYGKGDFQEAEKNSLHYEFDGILSCGGSAIYYTDIMEKFYIPFMKYIESEIMDCESHEDIRDLIEGIIDTNDLPLNVSREILQEHHLVDTIKKAVTKRMLDSLKALKKDSFDKYKEFWNEYGLVLKEGPAEDRENKDLIASLLLFASTYANSKGSDQGLDDYLERMSDDQDKIYYCVADTYEAAANSPHIEGLKSKGIQVLLLTDRIDEWVMAGLMEYQGKELVNVAKEDISDEDETKKVSEADQDILAKIKKHLDDKVSDVIISKRLTDSASCIVLPKHEPGAQLRKILEASGQTLGSSNPIFEINMKHKLVKKLKDMKGKQFNSFVDFLYDYAVIAEGGSPQDPSKYLRQLDKYLS